jgi:tetratricopeptide (TPR) repeat protein
VPSNSELLWGIRLFGPLAVTDPDGIEHRVASRKANELLAFLATRRNAIVDRDTIGDALWPDADFQVARNRLKTTLSILKMAVPGIPIIVHGKRDVELLRSAVVVDYEVCERRLKWRQSLTGVSRAAFARQILEIIRPGLLPECRVDWISGERERYVRLIAELEGYADPGDARVGFRLGGELGGVDVPLVGRENERRQIHDWLLDHGQRELQIVGAPGIGKTRLLREALQMADGVCDATIVQSTVQVSEIPWLDQLGLALGIQQPEEVAKGLCQLLGDFQRPLLVLDDLDQAQPEMLAWVDHLMGAIPHLKLLGAARRRPSKTTVAICDLAALPVEPGVQGPAFDLLLSFARQFGVREADLQANPGALSEIAEFLEGLPLALEVAAGWLSILQPATLRQKLQSFPEIVTQRSGVGRDSFVECVTAISRDLPDADRQALLLLSVCRGGCGEELAEEMLGSEWFWRVRVLLDRSLALRVVGHSGNRFLVVQALREAVRQVEGKERVAAAEQTWRDACFAVGKRALFEVDEGDRRRWLLWLRDEGKNILAACSEGIRDDHVLRDAIEVLGGFRVPFWLIAQAGVYRQVMSTVWTRGLEIFSELNAETPSPLIQHLVRCHTSEGQHTEAVVRASEYRKAVEASGDGLEIARALEIEAEARRFAGDLEGAIDCWTQASARYQTLGYPRHALWLLSFMNHCELSLGRYQNVVKRQELALSTARELEDNNSVGMYLKQAAATALEGKEFNKALEMSEEAVASFRRTGEAVTLSHSLLNLAATHLARNCFSAAQESLREAKMLDPEPDEEHRERIEILTSILEKRANPRAFYDSLTIEH